MKRLFFLFALSFTFSVAVAQSVADSVVFKAFLNFAIKEKLANQSAGDRMAAVGQFFLGTPYVACTLEGDGPERLQLNLHELDCTTFVENVLALSVVAGEDSIDWNAFKKQLTYVRYRHGVLEGYPSRLHYASDWLSDNQSKGLFSLLDFSRAGASFHPNVYYMSTHPDAYMALKTNSDFLPLIVAQEESINNLIFRYLPKEMVSPEAPGIHSGDIIAITTSMKGLDFSHLGIALRKEGMVYLLHASSAGGKVLISDKSLSEYLAGIKKHTGIVVARPSFSLKK
jgi:hypothetical protein